MAELLKGAPVAREIKVKTAALCHSLEERGITPSLAIVRSDDRDDTVAYERSATRGLQSQGIDVYPVYLGGVTAQEYYSRIMRLNNDEGIHGILILSPLPKGVSAERVSRIILPMKDVDGISPASLAAVFAGREEGFAPCTAEACMEMLRYYHIPIDGRKAAVVGRSLTVGRPAAMLLMAKNATVTICHTHTKNVAEVVRDSDIVIAATGKAKSLGRDAFAPGQTVIDVGYHEIEDGVCGDADIEAAKEHAAYVTPVPGGVGAVTTALLAYHTAIAAHRLTGSSA